MPGLYVHIPFCVRKCAYCDFYSVPGRTDLIDQYVKSVLFKASTYEGMAFDTLYLGGGTPSLLGAAGLTNLINGLDKIFNFDTLGEATIEVNPDSATPELLATARSIGITRLSIGVQSLSDRELTSVGRIHNASQALSTVKLAQSLGFPRISADVIVGLPEQDWQSLNSTLQTLIKLGVGHLSVYCLSLEEGTPLALNPPTNLPNDDSQAGLFQQATDFLHLLGFVHYEISNFALPGQECRHNLNYWRGGEYLGLGPAAASHLNGKRFSNAHNLMAYLENPGNQIEEVEELALPDKAAEETMLRLRLVSEGVSLEIIQERFGINAAPVIARLEGLANAGVLVRNEANYRLPNPRLLTANAIFARVLGD